jgi:hypothetical protein
MLLASVFPISSALRDIEKCTAVFLIPHVGLFGCPFMAPAAYAAYREDQWQRRSKHTELES